MGLCLGVGPVPPEALSALSERYAEGRNGKRISSQNTSSASTASVVSTASTGTPDRSARACAQEVERGGPASSSSRAAVAPPPPPPRRLSLTRPKKEHIDTNYQLGQQLGQGTTATVREAVHKSSGETVAVKIFSKAALSREDVSALLEEVAILRYLDSHPTIIRCLDFLEDSTCYYVVMELVRGGELFDRITAKSSYTEKEARDLFKVLVGALAYLHTKGIVHRDLKPENLLLQDANDDITVKIADFGFAAKVEGDHRSLSTQCGTPGYVAPEILRREAYGKPVDMWSLGVILYILLGGYPPFYDDDQRRLFEKIKGARFVFHPDIWDNVSDEAKDLIKRLLTVDVKQRMTAQQALQHPWVLKDDESLHSHNLEASKVQLKKHNARRKFRACVRSIIAANKMGLVLAKLRAEAVAKQQALEQAAQAQAQAMAQAQAQAAAQAQAQASAEALALAQAQAGAQAEAQAPELSVPFVEPLLYVEPLELAPEATTGGGAAQVLAPAAPEAAPEELGPEVVQVAMVGALQDDDSDDDDSDDDLGPEEMPVLPEDLMGPSGGMPLTDEDEGGGAAVDETRYASALG